MNKYARMLRRLLMPPKCAGCGKFLELLPTNSRDEALCPDCRGEWEKLKLRRCPRCLSPMIDCLCAPHELTKQEVTALIKLAPYGDKSDRVLRQMLSRLKNKAPRALSEFLVDQLAFPLEKLIKREGIDRENTVLTFAPRPKIKRRSIGFDQSEILSRLLAKRICVAYAPLIVRKKDLLEQKNLNATERKRNTSEAFSVYDVSLEGKTVILLDDVVTTGASMSACARLLRGVGAERIIAVSIASVKRRARSKKLKNTH